MDQELLMLVCVLFLVCEGELLPRQFAVPFAVQLFNLSLPLGLVGPRLQMFARLPNEICNRLRDWRQLLWVSDLAVKLIPFLQSLKQSFRVGQILTFDGQEAILLLQVDFFEGHARVHSLNLFPIDHFMVYILLQRQNYNKVYKMDPPCQEKVHFRQSYAKIIKYLLLKKSHLPVYQAERFMISNEESKQIATIWGQYFWNFFVADVGLKMIKNIKQMFKNAKIGKILSIAVIGLGFALDEGKISLSNELNNEEDQQIVNKIQNLFQKFSRSFRSSSEAQKFFKEIQNIDYINEFDEKKQALIKIISNPKNFQLETKTFLKLAGLYQLINKAIIVLNWLLFPQAMTQLLKNLREEHELIRIGVVKRIDNSVKVDKYLVKIGEFQILNKNQIFSCDIFKEEIYDQIFRCPFSGLLIEQMYKQESWKQLEDEVTEAKFKKANKGSRQMVKYLGFPLTEYTECISAVHGFKIRRVSYDLLTRKWCKGYFEDLVKKAGVHQQGYYEKEILFQFDKSVAVFLLESFIIPEEVNKNKKDKIESDQSTNKNLLLCGVTTNYQVKFFQVLEGHELPISKQFGYVIDLEETSFVSTMKIKSIKAIEITVKMMEPMHREVRERTGYIATMDMKNRLAFGYRNPWVLNFTYGFTFHGWKEDDPYQELLFDAITPVKYFKGSRMPQEFLCRIRSFGLLTMFMVRDNRHRMKSVFGNNTSGGELLLIKLREKCGDHYKGQIFGQNHNFTTFITAANDLYWSTTAQNEDRQTVFLFKFNQPEK